MAVVLGIWTLATPDTTLVALTLLFIVAFFVNGIVETIFSISNRHVLHNWGWRFAGGIIDILFGLLLVALPLPVITLSLIYFVGCWMLFRSMWTIGESIELQQLNIKGWGRLLTFGIASIIFATLFLLSPLLFKGVFVVVLVSTSLLLYGIFRIYFACALRAYKKNKDKRQIS